MTKAIFIGLLVVFCASCDAQKPLVVGRWNPEQVSPVVLYFYPDGTASISGTGFLNLEWKEIESSTVRIYALNRNIVFHFKIYKDRNGQSGTLELAGYDTLVFRKRSSGFH